MNQGFVKAALNKTEVLDLAIFEPWCNNYYSHYNSGTLTEARMHMHAAAVHSTGYL